MFHDFALLLVLYSNGKVVDMMFYEDDGYNSMLWKKWPLFRIYIYS